MRVLFCYRGIESLGVGYLMSMLEAHGHQIDLVFDPGLDDNLYLRVPQLRWLNRHEAMLERAKAFDPQLVAIGALTNLWPYAQEMATRLKEKLGVPIIVGGHHAQALPDIVLSHPAVDYVAIGEGENSLLELVTRMEQGRDVTSIPGIVAEKDGVVHRNPMGELESDLDVFPFPERDLWRENGCGGDFLEIFTGRGCPFRCTYCSVPYQRALFKGHGEFIRKRSVANVIEELRQYTARYDPKYVWVHDDNLTSAPGWLEEFCEVYRREINLPWWCFGHPSTIRRDLMKAMKAANCASIFMGVDSGSEEVRRRLMNRPMKDEVITGAARTIQEAGISLQVSAMYGCPGETAEQMWQTLEMVDHLRPTQCSSFIFFPFPGTKMHDLSVEMGYLDEKGQRAVLEGRSGYHHESILDHPSRQLAETMAKATPLYVRAPRFLKAPLRWMIGHHYKGLALWLYLLLFPLAFPDIGWEGLKLQARMAWRALRPANRASRRGSPGGTA